MGENYASLFQPWWAQGKSDNIQARLGMQPMTETAKQTSLNIAKTIDNPNWRLQEADAYWRQHGMVEKNPGLKTMGEVIDPSALYFIPGVGDMLLAGETVYDVATGDLGGGAALNAVLLAAPSAAAGAGKAAKAGKAANKTTRATKPRKKHLPPATKAGEFIEDGVEQVAYKSSQAGTPMSYAIPKAEVTRGAKPWVPTREEVIKAIATHFKQTKQLAQEGVRTAIDKAAGYKAAIQKMDRKLSRMKDPSDAKRAMYATKARTGQIETSVLPKVTPYLEEAIMSTFKPSKNAIKKNSYDLAVRDLMKHIEDLGYDTVTKESKEAIDKMISNHIAKQFTKQQGGSLNYLTLFS